MRFTYLPLLAGIGVCLALPAPCRAETLTLKSALAIAYETNPQLGGARAGTRAADEGVAEANAGWRPTVSASTSYGVQHGEIVGVAKAFNTRPFTGEVSVTENLFRGGRNFAETGRAIALVRASRAQLADAERGVLMNAVGAFMDVVRDEKIVAFNRKNVSALEKRLTAAKTERSYGAITRTDVAQTQARLARAKSELAGAQRQLADSRSAYLHVIGQPAPTLDPAPALPHLPASEQSAREIGEAGSPRVLEARANLKAADYAVSDAIGALMPKLSVSGQYQYVQDAGGTNIFATAKPQNILSVTGQITLPIYQGGAGDAAVRRAKELRSQSDLSVVTARRSARQDIDQAWNGLGAAKVQIAANEAEVAADRKALDGVSQEQQAGERSVLDILNAQQELLNAQVAMANAGHDYIVAAYKVLWATGQLSARGLALKVRYYDPHRHYEQDAGAWYGLGD